MRAAERALTRLREYATDDPDDEPDVESASRATRYRVHAALRRTHGLDYSDRGPATHADPDLVEYDDLDRLVGVDPSPALPGRETVDDVDEQDVEQVRAWRDRLVEDVDDNLREGAEAGAWLRWRWVEPELLDRGLDP